MNFWVKIEFVDLELMKKMKIYRQILELPNMNLLRLILPGKLKKEINQEKIHYSINIMGSKISNGTQIFLLLMKMWSCKRSFMDQTVELQFCHGRPTLYGRKSLNSSD